MRKKVLMALREPALPRSEEERARLGRLFVDHHFTVWRLLRRRGLSPDAAADATQETFLVAAHRLHEILPGSERAFLIATSRRVAHTLRRKTFRWLLEGEMDAREANVAREGDDVELCDLALSKVSADLAEVFVLYEVEGLSSPEIAALLEIPLGSVASRLRRGREQFRAAIARLEPDVARRGRR